MGLRLTGDDSIAHGELWEIPEELWKWLDHIEGNGFNYERKIVTAVRGAFHGEPAWVYEHMYKGFTDKEKIEGGNF